MHTNKINLKDIDLGSLSVILNKAGRVVDGINHGKSKSFFIIEPFADISIRYLIKSIVVEKTLLKL